MDGIVHRIKIMDAADVQDVRQQIHACREHWTARHPELPFFTLGAASYLDAAQGGFANYQEVARRFNPTLRRGFGDLLARVRTALSGLLQAPVDYDERLALPGFHIFLYHPLFAGTPSEPHYDLQYRHINWTSIGRPDFSRQLSMTCAIALPASGGGLAHWQLHRNDERPGVARVDHAALPPPAVSPYTCGYLNVHSGHRLHQIAATADPRPGDERITIQAHALPIDGRWLVYW